MDALEALSDPTHSSVDIHDRNILQKAVEREVRDYLQEMIMRNKKVTDHDMMGLPVRDTMPTPVGDPAGLVISMEKYQQEGSLELNVVHVKDTPTDKCTNYGVKIAYDMLPTDAPLPPNPETLRRKKFTRRKKHLFTFDMNEYRKTAVFCLRYENSKGKPGTWGPMVSAVIL